MAIIVTVAKGVGTAGATGALVPAMLKQRGRKYLLAPAIICQVYQLVDSQTSISLYSFKIFMRSSFVYCFTVRWSHKSHTLRLEPASQPENLRAERQKLE